MPCNLDLYPTDFPATSATGVDAISLELLEQERTAEAIAIAILQNQRTYGYDISMVQDAVQGGGLNALMPISVVSGAAKTAPKPVGSKGFFGGGFLPSSLGATIIDRMTFIDKTVSRLGYGFSNRRAIVGTFASKQSAYWAGGIASDIDKISFDTESVTKIGTVIETGPNVHSAGLTSRLAGYVAGGQDVAYNYFTVTSVQKVTFSNDAITLLAARLLSPAWGAIGLSSAPAGYVAGGQIGFSPAVAGINKLTYSSEAISLLGTGLLLARRNSAGVNAPLAGYVAGGLGTSGFFGGVQGGSSNGVSYSSIEKLIYANESISMIGATTGEPMWCVTAMNNNLYGYFGGGFSFINNISSFLSKINEFDIAGESISLLGMGFSDPRCCSDGAANYSPGWGD